MSRPEAERAVTGLKGARHKSFRTESEAKEWLMQETRAGTVVKVGQGACVLLSLWDVLKRSREFRQIACRATATIQVPSQ